MPCLTGALRSAWDDSDCSARPDRIALPGVRTPTCSSTSIYTIAYYHLTIFIKSCRYSYEKVDGKMLIRTLLQ